MTSKKFNISKKEYLKWRSPIFGDDNPAVMTNKVWEWLILTKISAYQAEEEMEGPGSFDYGPVWCFDRFGQSFTRLEDGRGIYIAGEHEDHYDPDFNIYNDVVVISKTSVEIYGYPEEVFPPTDFHSATLVNDQIYIIGNLGYLEKRKTETTPVYLLDTNNYRITEVSTHGENPGWIYEHTAEYDEAANSIVIKKGKVDLGDDLGLNENIDDWCLCLESKKWQRLTKRQWQRWEVRRSDDEFLNLFDIRYDLDIDFSDADLELDDEMITILEESREDKKAFITKKNKEILKTLYSPPIDHIIVDEEEGEYNEFIIIIDDIRVRYIEEMYEIKVVIEGQLEAEKLLALQQDLKSKLYKIQNCKIELKNIPG